MVPDRLHNKYLGKNNTPAPGAERSRTVYTIKNLVKKVHRLPEPNNGPGPFTQTILRSKRHRLPEPNNGPGPFTQEIFRSSDTGSRSQTTVPDRYKWMFSSKRHRLPKPNGPGPFI